MIDHASAIVLAALIAAIAPIMLAWHKIHTSASGQNPASNTPASTVENAAQICSTTTSSVRSTSRRALSLLPLLLIAWGQLNIAAAQWLDDGSGGLSVWSLSFVAQGSIMLLLGFWLLLRD